MTALRMLAWVLAGTLVAPAAARAQVPVGAPILVLPFDNPTHAARLTWMREGAAILLAETPATKSAHA